MRLNTNNIYNIINIAEGLVMMKLNEDYKGL